MIKMFFITFFLAELVIAVAIIARILQVDKYVNALDKKLTANQNKLRFGFIDLRVVFEDFAEGVGELKDAIQRKREEYLFSFLKTSFVYGSLLFLKGNFRKAILTYQLGKEIYEGLQES